jgi:hypothetical protein
VDIQKRNILEFWNVKYLDFNETSDIFTRIYLNSSLNQVNFKDMDDKIEDFMPTFLTIKPFLRNLVPWFPYPFSLHIRISN